MICSMMFSLGAYCRILLVSLIAGLLVANPAHAEKRVALVIGNGAYTHAPPLPNPAHDAEDVAAALKRSGRPEEIVTAALYLAASKSSFTTGSVVRVDGGIA